MATRTKKKTARKSAPSRALARLEERVPARFGDYVSQMQGRLDRLEKQISAAQTTAMKRATHLLKDASRQLGRLEERGEKGWRRLSMRYRREAVKLLRRIEDAIAPPPTRRKSATRKAAPRARAQRARKKR